MKVKFLALSKNDFHGKQLPVLFHDETTDRCFGVILGDNLGYKFSWRSDLIDPILTKIKNGVYGLGIDQKFAIIDFNSNTVLLKLDLSYFFYQVEVCLDLIYVITELEIIKIDTITFLVIQDIGLPDIFKEIIFDHQSTKVICWGNVEVYL